jgi:hypothetical protein
MYGDKLVCVRYRYDTESGRRFKTIEIIVEEKEWAPRNHHHDQANGFADD